MHKPINLLPDLATWLSQFEIGGHWVGIRLAVNENGGVRITFYNSLHNEDNDLMLMVTIMRELRNAQLNPQEPAKSKINSFW